MMWVSRNEGEAQGIIEKASKMRCVYKVRYSDMRDRGYGERWIVTVRGLLEKHEMQLVGCSGR